MFKTHGSGLVVFKEERRLFAQYKYLRTLFNIFFTLGENRPPRRVNA
jgi:hypothetical protein